MEVVSLIFDIEEKFDIQIPVNANMDIESKTLRISFKRLISSLPLNKEPQRAEGRTAALGRPSRGFEDR